MNFIRVVGLSLITLASIAFSLRARSIITADARNVKSYGAKGDGVADDTQAFLNALNQARDSQPPFLSAAAVYVPSGTYLIKKTLILWRKTRLFGEWTNPPTLVLASDSPDFQNPSDPKPFIVTAGGYNLPAYSTDWKRRKDLLNGSTNNTFFIFIEDLNIKIAANNPGCDHAILWACAQQTGIRNVNIDAGQALTAIETGLDGGGGVWSDLTVSNGQCGFRANATSELMVRDCTFNVPVTIGNYYLCNWTFLATTFNSPYKGVTLEEGSGAVAILNSRFSPNTPLISKEKKCLHLENVEFDSVDRPGTAKMPRHRISGKIINDVITSVDHEPRTGATRNAIYKSGIPYPRPSTLCINIKDFGAKGDGTSDDTVAIREALRSCSEIFFPLGTYLVSGPLIVNAGQKLFGQSVGSVIQLAAGSRGFEVGKRTPFVSVNGRGKRAVTIVGLWFWNFAEGGRCCLWNADSSSVVMDSQFINESSSNTQPAWVFQSGGGFVENCWNPGNSSYGLVINSADSLWLYSVQEEHYTGTALRIEGAANVVGLNLQFENSHDYVSIKNSQNIHLDGILAGNWNFNSRQLVEVENSKVALYGLEINRNEGGIVLDKTTNRFRHFGTSERNGNFVILDRFTRK